MEQATNIFMVLLFIFMVTILALPIMDNIRERVMYYMSLGYARNAAIRQTLIDFFK
jgi:hypothetical protein